MMVKKKTFVVVVVVIVFSWTRDKKDYDRTLVIEK